MADQAIEQIGMADVVIGLVPSSNDAEQIGSAIRRILQFTPLVRAVLVHPPYSENGAEPLQPGTPWQLMPNTQLAQDPSALAQSLGDSFRAVYEITRSLGARACAVVASDLSTVTEGWVTMLLEPIVDGRFDLVTPCYARHPFEGMINRAIVYPLVRALYGKHIRNPLGPDFGISSALVEKMAAAPRNRVHPLASLSAEAATSGMKICQSHLGPRVYPGPDWTNLSSLLSQVLGPLFIDVERNAPQWQRARESQAIPEFGVPQYVAGPESAVDVTRVIDSFKLGARNLPEVWGMILAPSTLVELKRLALKDASGFRMPDETWARIVYDFALAHRLRTISRDQMLRALTPIYLGWVASYALEVENAAPDQVEQRVENLCVAYENTKSHFVARWRWPDRFNP